MSRLVNPNILSNVNKSIRLLCKFQLFLARSLLLTVYKIFICSHVDYADVVYDQNDKSYFHKKLDLIQCKAALAITAWKVSKYGVISGPYAPVFGLNTARYSVSLRIQSKYMKIRTRNNSVYGHFLRSE